MTQGILGDLRVFGDPKSMHPFFLQYLLTELKMDIQISEFMVNDGGLLILNNPRFSHPRLDIGYLSTSAHQMQCVYGHPRSLEDAARDLLDDVIEVGDYEFIEMECSD